MLLYVLVRFLRCTTDVKSIYEIAVDLLKFFLPLRAVAVDASDVYLFCCDVVLRIFYVYNSQFYLAACLSL
jgi:hypothetical protein